MYNKILAKNKGITLTSMLVGMLISSFILIGTTQLYLTAHSTIFGQNGVMNETKRDKTVGQAMIQTQMAVNGAGFAVDGIGVNSTFVSFQNAELDADFLNGTATFGLGAGTKNVLDATDKTANLILWERNDAISQDKADYTCMGFYSNLSNNAYYYLKSNTSCNPISTNFAAGDWQVIPLIAANTIDSPITFALKTTVDCAPYGVIPESISGIPELKGGLNINIAYNGTDGVNQNFDVCMVNFYSP